MSTYYVSISGNSSNDGSQASPWDLQTALSGGNGVVGPGDEIVVTKGRYIGAFEFDSNTPSGEPGNPITLRGKGFFESVIEHPNQLQAEAGLFLKGNESGGCRDWIIRDLQGTGPVTANRNSAQEGSFPTDVPRHAGVTAQGLGQNPLYAPDRLKIINCLFQNNVGGGAGFWSHFVAGEFYGNICYHNGWVAPDRGHGHGLYIQSRQGHQARANILFRSSGGLMQTFGSSAAVAHGMVISDNINFDANVTTRVGQRCFLVGGGIDIKDLVFQRNYTYVSLPLLANGGEFAPETTFENVRIRDNWFHSSRAWALKMTGTPVEFAGNRVIGQTNGFNRGDWPANDYGQPGGTWVSITPNEYEQGRANVAVYNFDGADSVDIDLSNVLQLGQQYSIWDVQALLTGGAVVTGVYDGNPVSVPLTLTKVDPWHGLTIQQPHTPPEFNAFLVRAMTPAPPPPPEESDTATVTIVVDPPDPPPPNGLQAVIIASPLQGKAPLTVQFDGSGSLGSPAQYRWEFGDGTAAEFGPTAAHTYQTAGTFQPQLTVTR